MNFSILVIKRYSYFLGLSCLICVFSFLIGSKCVVQMVGACGDGRRFGQKVGKSQESHIPSKVLVFRYFTSQRKGYLLLPYSSNYAARQNYCPYIFKYNFLFVFILFAYQVATYFCITLRGNNGGKVDYHLMDDFYSFHIKFTFIFVVLICSKLLLVQSLV